jgi:uncharacterized protein (DUF3084 family)
MNQNNITKKGFVHIPLLMIVGALIITVSAAVVVGLQIRNPNKPAQTTDIVESGQKEMNEGIIKTEDNEPEEMLQEDRVEQLPEKINQQELERAKLEAEKAKQETEKAKIEIEKLKIEQEKQKSAQDQIKQNELLIQQEAARLKEEQGAMQELKIEQCKSEYNAHKSAASAEIERQLNILGSLTQDMEKESLKKCIAGAVDQFTSTTGTSLSAVSGQTVASLTNWAEKSCQNTIDETHKKFVLEIDSNKKLQYDKLEQQLQSEYQQCLQK